MFSGARLLADTAVGRARVRQRPVNTSLSAFVPCHAYLSRTFQAKREKPNFFLFGHKSEWDPPVRGKLVQQTGQCCAMALIVEDIIESLVLQHLHLDSGASLTAQMSHWVESDVMCASYSSLVPFPPVSAMISASDSSLCSHAAFIYLLFAFFYVSWRVSLIKIDGCNYSLIMSLHTRSSTPTQTRARKHTDN